MRCPTTPARGEVGHSEGCNEDSVKILGFWHFFVSRNPRNLRPESSSLVSTSFTHSGDDEDSGDSGIISLFFLLESPESSRRIQLQNVCILHWPGRPRASPRYPGVGRHFAGRCPGWPGHRAARARALARGAPGGGAVAAAALSRGRAGKKRKFSVFPRPDWIFGLVWSF